METTQKQRIKLFIDYLLQHGEIQKFAEFGEILGIKNKSRLSQLIGGSVNNESFINRLLIQWPNLNRTWLLTGEGQMLNNSQNENSGTIVNGDGNSFFDQPEKKEGLADFAARVAFLEKQNEEKDAAIKKRDQQIDRLLTIIEHQNGINNQ